VSDASGDRVIKIDKKGALLMEFGKSTAMFKSGQENFPNPRHRLLSSRRPLCGGRRQQSLSGVQYTKDCFNFPEGKKGQARDN